MGKSINKAMEFEESELLGLFGRKPYKRSQPVSNVKASKGYDMDKISTGELVKALSVRLGRFLSRHSTACWGLVAMLGWYFAIVHKLG